MISYVTLFKEQGQCNAMHFMCSQPGYYAVCICCRSVCKINHLRQQGVMSLEKSRVSGLCPNPNGEANMELYRGYTRLFRHGKQEDEPPKRSQNFVKPIITKNSSHNSQTSMHFKAKMWLLIAQKSSTDKTVQLCEDKWRYLLQAKLSQRLRHPLSKALMNNDQSLTLTNLGWMSIDRNWHLCRPLTPECRVGRICPCQEFENLLRSSIFE